MRIPQKTPWTSLGELDELCSWIYADSADSQSRTLSIQRLSAWRAITTLPHALESLLGLLVVILQDEKGHPPTSSLSLRQSYATALIRLVNGLVDPLQIGVYARSIASIAAQLGLPVRLVELRHAATHEDMPSLEMLREAAHESMDWLLHNYLLPTLNPTARSNSHNAPLRPIAPLLVQYKFLMKAITRDTTLLAQYQADIDKMLRDIERWVAEAKVEVDVTTGEFGWNGLDSSEEEAWALERLSDELIQRGALVPVSRRKRALPKGTLHPPSSLIALWNPLLQSLESHHPSFTSTLLTRVVSRLLSRPQDPSTELDDQPPTLETTSDLVSYETCLASWVIWLIRPRNHRTTDIYTAKQDAFIALAVALGPRTGNRGKEFPGAWALLKALCTSDEHLASVSKSILTPTGEPCTSDQSWKDDDMETMDKRLNEVLAVENDDACNVELSVEATSAATATNDHRGDTGLPSGWRTLDVETTWRPCPIGIYISA